VQFCWIANGLGEQEHKMAALSLENPRQHPTQKKNMHKFGPNPLSLAVSTIPGEES